MGQRLEMNKIKEQKNEKMLSSLYSLHHLLYSWENVVTNIDLWVATKLDSLLLRTSVLHPTCAFLKAYTCISKALL